MELNIEYQKTDTPRKVNNNLQNEIGSMFTNLKHEVKPREVSMDIERSFMVNIDLFFNDLRNIGNMTDAEVNDFVVNSFMQILDLVVRTKENPYYALGIMNVFSNERYINSLINILQNVKLDYTHKVYLNHIIYDYRAYKGYNKDILINKLHSQLADVVNIDIMPKLYGTGLDRELLSYLAICKFSSFEPIIVVKRVNLALFNSDIELSLQNIVDIYQFLFSDGMANLFNGVMLDPYSAEDLNNSTENQKEIYSLQSLAVLEMINVMPSESIKVILSGYSYSAMGRPIRFSMKLSNDYWRINTVIDELYSQGIYVP